MTIITEEQAKEPWPWQSSWKSFNIKRCHAVHDIQRTLSLSLLSLTDAHTHLHTHIRAHTHGRTHTHTHTLKGEQPTYLMYWQSVALDRSTSSGMLSLFRSYPSLNRSMKFEQRSVAVVVLISLYLHLWLQFHQMHPFQQHVLFSFQSFFFGRTVCKNG